MTETSNMMESIKIETTENAEEDATSMKEKGCYFGYSDRDPNKINSHINLHWNEMFAEPPLFQSLEPCWQFNKWIYTGCAKFGYIFLATILGPFIACFYGMVFCFTAFTYIWCCHPVSQLMALINIRLSSFFKLFMDSYCGPCMKTIGLLFSNIKITLNQGPATEDQNEKIKVSIA